MLRSILSFRHALWSMSTAQLKSRYAGSVLGISWAIFNPLLMMFAITFVFVWVLKTETKHFSLLVLSGIMPWMFFSNAVSEAADSILNHQNVTRQFNFPTAILPLSSVLSNFLNFLIGWAVIYPLFIFYNPKIIVLAPLLPLVLILLLFFVCGLGLALSVLNVFFRDISHLLGVVLMFWFWVTPIFYSIERVPLRFVWLYNINPMTPFVTYFHKIIFEGTMPSFAIFLGALTWAVLSFVAGWAIFIRLEPRLSKRF